MIINDSTKPAKAIKLKSTNVAKLAAMLNTKRAQYPMTAHLLLPSSELLGVTVVSCIACKCQTLLSRSHPESRSADHLQQETQFVSKRSCAQLLNIRLVMPSLDSSRLTHLRPKKDYYVPCTKMLWDRSIVSTAYWKRESIWGRVHCRCLTNVSFPEALWQTYLLCISINATKQSYWAKVSKCQASQESKSLKTCSSSRLAPSIALPPSACVKVLLQKTRSAVTRGYMLPSPRMVRKR